MTAALVAGLGLGALVAAQVGPIWLLCARTSARYGFRPGFAIGLAAALVDFGYAVLGALGAAVLLQAAPMRIVLGLGGAAVLVWLGARTLHAAFRIRAGAESVEEVADPKRAFRTGAVATASNPLTIVSWGAVFGGAAVADVAGTPSSAVAFVVGIGIGSLLFHLVLSGALAVLGGRVGERGLLVVDAISGLGLIAFGGLLAVRTVRDS
ncbi:MAG: LysE family transporter [Candidatus Nanopelagicales bacterium]